MVLLEISEDVLDASAVDVTSDVELEAEMGVAVDVSPVDVVLVLETEASEELVPTQFAFEKHKRCTCIRACTGCRRS